MRTMPRSKPTAKHTEKQAAETPEIVQEHPEDAPAGWAAVQEKLAAKEETANIRMKAMVSADNLKKHVMCSILIRKQESTLKLH